MDKEYTELVTQGKKAANVQWVLGDLALKVDKKYGENSLAQYAEDIGIDPTTLKHYRRVSGAYEIGRRRPILSWSIYELFSAQEDRLELVKKTWTVREARQFLQERANPHPEPEPEPDDEEDGPEPDPDDDNEDEDEDEDAPPPFQKGVLTPITNAAIHLSAAKRHLANYEMHELRQMAVMDGIEIVLARTVEISEFIKRTKEMKNAN